ncbi:unnamed protein product [Rhizophagus irregularis]|nr:unnamed protein product [Rhizophagus irregularis]
MSYNVLNKITDTNVSKEEENFLKDLLKYFYIKIVETENNFINFEYISNDWIESYLNKYDKNPKKILEMMEYHKESKFWFTSLIGFFYQIGIGCDKNKEKALEFYLIDIDNKKIENDSLININFNQLHLIIEKNEDSISNLMIMRNYNIIIKKYLLSLFYYKDNILLDIKYKQNKLVNLLKLIEYDDLEVQYNSIICYENGDSNLITNYRKVFKLLSSLTIDNNNLDAQYNLAICYMDGIGTQKDEKKAFDLFLKADQIENASIWDNTDNIKFFKKNLESAVINNSIAQNNLGNCYNYGTGTKENKAKAFKWNR